MSRQDEYIDVDVAARSPRSSEAYRSSESYRSGDSPRSSRRSGMKPEKKASGIGHAILKPLEVVGKSLKWICTPSRSGGARYLAYTAAIGCAMLGVENIYVFMHKDAQAEHRFIPKLGLVDDGAELGRLIPLPAILDSVQNTGLAAANLLGADMPDTYKPRVGLIVWFDPRFLVALAGGLFLSSLQASAVRRVSLQIRKQQLQKSASTDADIDATLSSYEQRVALRTETKMRRAQVAHHGNGKVFLFGAVVLTSYLVEFVAFAASAVPGSPFIQSVILGLLSTFGTEGNYALAELFSEREDSE